MFGLDIDTLRNIKSCFEPLSNIEKVLIYGSRAKGNYRIGSDIDITLLGNNLNLSNSVYPLMGLLDELYLPYKFDISIFSQLDNSDFISHILRVGKTFYEKEVGIKGDSLSGAEGKSWAVKTLGEVCDIYNGSTPSRTNKEFWKRGDVNWFTVDDIRKQGRIINYTEQKITEKGLKNTSLKLLPKKTVLLCCTASVGEFAITNIELTTNQQFNGMIVKDNNYLLPEYLFHFSSTLKNCLLDVSGKTTIAFVSMTKLKKITIPLPPLSEQKKIVAILDKSFVAIDQAKANIEKNIQNAKELFQSKLNDIFSQKGKDWEEKTLGEVCEKTKNIKWQEHSKQEFQYIDLSSVSRETLSVTETTTVNEENAPSRAKKIIHFGDVIFATTRPTLKRATIIDEKLSGQICSTGYVVLRPKEHISSAWIFFYLLTSKFMDRIESLQRGTSYPAVTDNDVKEAKLLVPSSKEKKKKNILEMNQLRKKTNDLIFHYQQKSDSLDELKKSILQKAFSGQLPIIH